MPRADELIGSNRSVEEIGELIGADKIIYQDLDALVDAARKGNPEIPRFDLSCFDGQYVTGDVNESYLNHLEALRSDEAKAERAASQNALSDLHNSEEEMSADI